MSLSQGQGQLLDSRGSIGSYLERARARIDRIPAVSAWAALGRGATLVDVRTREQIQQDGRIPGALEITLNVLEWRLALDAELRHTDAPALEDLVIVLCDEGYCSSLAAVRLQDIGFARATDVIGGLREWKAQRLPLEP